jgi:hypothetical protein
VSTRQVALPNHDLETRSCWTFSACNDATAACPPDIIFIGNSGNFDSQEIIV